MNRRVCTESPATNVTLLTKPGRCVMVNQTMKLSTDEERAAICIQSYYRAYSGRKRQQQQQPDLSDTYPKEEEMRLKYSGRHLEEDSFLLSSSQLDTKGLHRSRINSRIAPVNVRIQRGWHSLQLTENKRHLVNFKNSLKVGYHPSLISPLENGSDRATSLSSPEIIYRNNNVEDESFSESDQDCNEINLHIQTLTLQENSEVNGEIEISDDCNNNTKSANSFISKPIEDPDSEDSLFSNILDSSQDYVLDHLENNNNENYISESVINPLKEPIKLNEQCLSEKSLRKFHSLSYDEVTQEERVCSVSSVEQERCKKYNCANSDSGSSHFADKTSMSETRPYSDFDINMATETLNNFSMATSKHCDIQCLFSNREEIQNVNIRQIDSQSASLDEPKILNTASTLPKNMTSEYQERLKNKDKMEVSTLLGYTEKCAFDSVEKEREKGKTRDDVNFKHGRCGANVVINPFSMDHPSRCKDNDGEKGENCLGSSCENCEEILKMTESIPEKLEKTIEKTHELAKTRMCSEKRAELFVPGIEMGLESINVSTINSLQWQQSDERNAISSSGYDMIQRENSFLRNAEEQKCMLSDNNLNNNSITNNAVFKSVAEKVMLPSPFLSDSEKRTSLLAGKNTSKSIHSQRDNCSSSLEGFGNFEFYNIETTMPNIDWDAMEAHFIRAAEEPNWFSQHHDREEIRRKLAVDSDSEDYFCGKKVTKKPSLSTRLQSGMNLQICFMNETASDQESQGSDHDIETSYRKESVSEELSVEETARNTNVSDHNKIKSSTSLTESSGSIEVTDTKRQRPSFFFNRPRSWSLRSSQKNKEIKEKNEKIVEDFVTRQARLQSEARVALAQAKDMARMQMEVERQRKKKSPIADIVGFPLPDGHRHLTRQTLSDLNIAQLQVIVNDLHTQIESFNEDLVQLLLERDDLLMQQDSMLVDIEDLTRYLGAKNEALSNQQSVEKTGSLLK
ncbi:uncharacterized protein LOC106472046 isoform X2 [Limulus polyphemus]|uniref:Uncharacterized protein LOC106472046 isoform X2 n=1 Tax=Limulus polyphemus TaxID=6850 RepID=A0ABM1TMT4_LIMPO|nr:uncharacterized protein LOC106472046 isoform X2 [Limulus polyphemus]